MSISLQYALRVISDIIANLHATQPACTAVSSLMESAEGFLLHLFQLQKALVYRHLRLQHPVSHLLPLQHKPCHLTPVHPQQQHIFLQQVQLHQVPLLSPLHRQQPQR